MPKSALKTKTKVKQAKKQKPALKLVSSRKKPSRILSASEPPPFRIENQKGKGLGLIICDHGSYRVPASLKGMGIKKADLLKHIGWDIGAEDASRHLAKVLDMPAIMANYSRLVTDLNRAPHYHECMIEVSDHIKIPANAGLSKAERDQRLKEIYWPYQNQIGKQVDKLLRKKAGVPFLIAVHSFTPQMDGFRRPWHIAVLWNNEVKIAKQLVYNLRKNHPDLLIGENEPYSLKGERFAGSTMCRHAEERGLPYVFVEFRQDLIDTKEKAVRWADMFLQALTPLLESPDVQQGRKIKPLKKQK